VEGDKGFIIEYQIHEATAHQKRALHEGRYWCPRPLSGTAFRATRLITVPLITNLVFRQINWHEDSSRSTLPHVIWGGSACRYGIGGPDPESVWLSSLGSSRPYQYIYTGALSGLLFVPLLCTYTDLYIAFVPSPHIGGRQRGIGSAI
jgi:hypothetical protein